MNLSDEFYENLTADKLEEYIEFVEWSRIPIPLITEELKIKFSFFKEVVAMFWFKELLNSLETKKFADVIFFYKEEKVYMSYDVEYEILWCLNKEIWSVVISFGVDVYFFIKNIIEKIFIDIKVAPNKFNDKLLGMIQEEFEDRVLLK